MIKVLKVAYIVLTRTIPILYDPRKSDADNIAYADKCARTIQEESGGAYHSATVQPFKFETQDGWDPHLWIEDDYPTDDGFSFDPDKDTLH